MLLVYTHKITPRITYIFKHICKRILGLEVSFTTTIEDFIAHQSLKMSYTTKPLASEFFIESHALLFEQGLSDLVISVLPWQNTKCFFKNSEASSLPFDIFAASFYLISRYEEYLPHVKDEFGRFTAQESLAYKQGFLEQPVIDIWAYQFKSELSARFDDFIFKERHYNVEPIIDVPTAYYYKHKGLMRTLSGTIKDLFKLKMKSVYRRYQTLFNFAPDPYNTFNWIIQMQKQTALRFRVFFLIGNYSAYDKNISIGRKAFITLIKSIADYCNVGLKASFLALDNIVLYKQEKKMLETLTHTQILMSRHSHSKLNIPTTYRHLIDLEIHKDYTMGFPNYFGFRAGTCTPFLFYDLDYETQTPLEVHPFQLMDFSLLKIKSQLDKQQKLDKLIKRIKDVNGTFTFVFHNYTFSNAKKWQGFKALFSQILNSHNE